MTSNENVMMMVIINDEPLPYKDVLNNGLKSLFEFLNPNIIQFKKKPGTNQTGSLILIIFCSHIHLIGQRDMYCLLLKLDRNIFGMRYTTTTTTALIN